MCYNILEFLEEIAMNVENICKFNPLASNDLVCRSFVLEVRQAQKNALRASEYGIYLVTKGEGVLNVEKEKIKLSRGCLFFTVRGELFSIEGDQELEYMYISFLGRRADEYSLRIGIADGNRFFTDCACLIPFWSECLERADDKNIDMLSEAVLLYSLAFLMPKPKESSDLITQIVILTNDNFADPDLSLSEISKRLGYSSKYISTAFKKHKGIGYTEYLRDIRINHAVFLIEQGVVSVKNIAFLSGFRDPLYFSKVFCERMGVPPKIYIKNFLNEA